MLCGNQNTDATATQCTRSLGQATEPVVVLLQAWCMIHWLDDILGRLFDFLETSPLRDNTYVMFASDNGPQMLPDEMANKYVSSLA